MSRIWEPAAADCCRRLRTNWHEDTEEKFCKPIYEGAATSLLRRYAARRPFGATGRRASPAARPLALDLDPLGHRSPVGDHRSVDPDLARVSSSQLMSAPHQASVADLWGAGGVRERVSAGFLAGGRDRWHSPPLSHPLFQLPLTPPQLAHGAECCCAD